MRRYLYAAACAAVATLLTAVPALASSNAVLSDSAANPNGTNTPVGTIITGTGKAQFITTAGGRTGIFCDSTITITIVTNPPAPGTAVGSITSWTFTNCTINISGLKAVNGIRFDNLPYSISFASPPPDAITVSPGGNGSIHLTVIATTIFNQQVNCGYHVHASSGNISGTAGNGTNTISFSNQQFDGDSGNNFQCGATLFFSATYTFTVFFN